MLPARAPLQRDVPKECDMQPGCLPPSHHPCPPQPAYQGLSRGADRRHSEQLVPHCHRDVHRIVIVMSTMVVGPHGRR